MGSVLSRREEREEAEGGDTVGHTHQYRFPPKSGAYFGGHFLMGGERFEAGPGDGDFLFGENADLNFLSGRSTAFPYPPSGQSAEPTRTLQCLLNLRRDTLKLVRVPDSNPAAYNVEFVFDSDVPITVQLLYFVSETPDPVHGVVYTPRDPTLSSPVYRYDMGAGQRFCQASHAFVPGVHKAQDLAFDPAVGIFPLLVRCVAVEANPVQTQATLGFVSESAEGSGGWVAKPLKQKLCVGGVAYLLQEIFGIENKNPGLDSDGDPKVDASGAAESLGDLEENGADCVVCMSELRDTLILPCRHLCLCNACAETLRYKASNCPICRSPFKALLQIKTLRRVRHSAALESADQGPGSEEEAGSLGPLRYEAVSLVEALNGPMDHTQTCPSLPAPTPQPPATASKGPPSAPPRGHRQHRKKRSSRSAAGIQEVLTPATIPAAAAAAPSSALPQPDELEMTVREPELPETGMIEVSPVTEETTTIGPASPVSPSAAVLIEEEGEEKSAASSLGSHKALLPAAATTLDIDPDDEDPAHSAQRAERA